MKHDIVYIVKNDCDSEELRYSIRSVVQNFPYRKLVIVGGKPDGIEPDIYIYDEQKGSTKWQKNNHSLKIALNRDDLTEDIWLFNDDFFIMDKVKGDVNYFNGTLEKRILTLRRKFRCGSGYIRMLEVARGKLANRGKDTLSFSLHVPFLINRNKALELFGKFPDLQMFRSVYGNYWEIDCQYMKDCKVHDLESIPDTPYISTTDESFKNGKVGEFLRKYFDKPSKYEITEEERLRKETKELFDEEGELRYES